MINDGSNRYRIATDALVVLVCLQQPVLIVNEVFSFCFPAAV